MQDEFSFLERAGVPINHPDAAWLVVGWGARDFYTQTGSYSDLSLRPIWRGITGDDSVLRFDVTTDEVGHIRIEKVKLSQDQFSQLVGTIRGQLAAATPLEHPGFTDTDAFYPATQRFHIFKTCNVWVGQQLRAAGVRFGIWTPTTFSVRLSAWLYQ